MELKSKDAIRAYLREQAKHSSEDFVWIRFHGDEYLGDICIDAEEVAECDDPYGWINTQLEDYEDEALVETYREEITNGDYEIVDAEGFVNSFCCFSHWGSCDWSEYKAFLDEDEDKDMLIAGIACGIPLKRIAEVCCGQADSDEDFARETVESCYNMDDWPSFLVYHIDWEGVARDVMMDYLTDNGYYFHANY